MSVFIDTSAFVSLISSEDAQHGAARETWRQILASEEELYTTNYVVVETTALLHSRFGVPPVRRFLEDVLQVVDVAWVDQAAHGVGVRAVLAGGRQGPSLVDCVSFEMIARLQVERVFAYDRHFTAMGYDVCGPEESTRSAGEEAT